MPKFDNNIKAADDPNLPKRHMSWHQTLMGEKFDITTMRRQTTLTAKKYVNAHGFSPQALV